VGDDFGRFSFRVIPSSKVRLRLSFHQISKQPTKQAAKHWRQPTTEKSTSKLAFNIPNNNNHNNNGWKVLEAALTPSLEAANAAAVEALAHHGLLQPTPLPTFAPHVGARESRRTTHAREGVGWKTPEVSNAIVATTPRRATLAWRKVFGRRKK
jgi:hypothetical protein